jgi:ketosteroid isomerase-like protein
MDKAAAIRHFDSFDIKFVRAEFEDLTVQVHGDDAAIAKYRDVSTVKTNGILTKKPVQFTNVWVKKDGAWKIVAEHSSVAAPPELLPRNRFADNLARK